MKLKLFVVLFVLLATLTLLTTLTFWSSDAGSHKLNHFIQVVTSGTMALRKWDRVPCQKTGRNILAIYTGRWEYMRILLPHVYRELWINGGILDEVWFMIVKADNSTITRLKKFVQVVNKIQKKQIFSIHEKKTKTDASYTYAYYKFFSHLNNFPNDKFFKFDDDIVYVRPRAFNYLVEAKDSSRCFMHFFNIAGSNWRCSWIHQRNGVYNDTNPKNLKFDFSPWAACGLKGPDCGELSLKTFLHHYKKHQLKQYYFKDMELTPDRSRFSINAYLLDKDLIDIKTMLEVGKIYPDDEKWWTVAYSAKVQHPNCIVGEALVVHFAYGLLEKKMLSLGLLKMFSKIIEETKNSFNVEESIWKLLDFI